MSDDQIHRIMVHDFGLRIQPHMTEYVRRRLLKRAHASIPVMGGDARTGVAVRKIIALRALQDAAAAGAARA
jgi:hypothetical protein